jgi:amino acid transporter
VAAPSRATGAWNTLGYILYLGLVVVGLLEIYLSFFFAMATDGCHDAACDAGYHVWPAMLVLWVGVGAVLLLTLIVMFRNTSRGKVVAGWPLLGLAGLGLVYAIADAILH